MKTNLFPLKELVGTKKDILNHLKKWLDVPNINIEALAENDESFQKFIKSILDEDTIVTYWYDYPMASRKGYYALRNGDVVGMYNVIMS